MGSSVEKRVIPSRTRRRGTSQVVCCHTNELQTSRHAEPSWIAKAHSCKLFCDCGVPRLRFAPLGMTTLLMSCKVDNGLRVLSRAKKSAY
jgi:hypothetical protein